MAEYIERGELLRQIRDSKVDDPTEGYEWKFAHDHIAGIVKDMPASDVAPVVRGRWVGLEYDGYADGNPVYDLWECSECGEEVRGEDVPETHPYCPNCGAKMEG